MRIRLGGSLRLGAGIPAWSIRHARSMNLPRASGVQLHPTSLPGGRLGRDAYAFVDWLAAAGPSWLQLLPPGPPDPYGSAYKAKAAVAARPGLLAEPRAPVSPAAVCDFRARS